MDFHHPTVKTMVAWASRFARLCVLNANPRPQVVLSGKSGCGKTMVARRASRIIRENAIDAWAWGPCPRPPVVAFADWSRLSEIRQPEDYEDAARDIREADIVFLDDLGAEIDKFRSGEHTGRLRRLLSDIEGKAVFITTNLKSSEWAAKWDGRVESRLSAFLHLDCFAVPDYRPSLAAK